MKILPVGWGEKISWFLVTGGLIGLGLCSSPAGDPIIFSSASDKASLPPADPKEQGPGKVGGLLGRDTTSTEHFQVPLAAPAPAVSDKLNSKRAQEWLDQQKNWMFQTPGDLQNRMQLGNSLETSNKRPDNPFDVVPHGAITRFLQGPSVSNAAPTSRGSDSTSNNRQSDDKNNNLNTESNPRTGLEQPAELGFSRLFDQTSGRLNLASPMNESALNPFVSVGSAAATAAHPGFLGKMEQAREQQKRMEEFRQWLVAPPSGPPLLGGNDPINSLMDSTRQPAQPVMPKGLSDSSLGSSVLTPIAGGNPLGRVDHSGGFGTADTRALSPSSLAPMVATPPEPRFVQPQPPVLEMPRRRF